MNPIVFPPAPKPLVSVLIVTFGAQEFVEKALRALAANTEPSYEVIVVDNGSPGEVLEFLRNGIRGARVVENGRNTGFGPASNQAAGFARGEDLLFLNSDAFVHEGWLPPMLETLDDDPSVAGVGPRVLNVDGTLQEAGSIIYRDGCTGFRGFGDDPARPEYLERRVVDYCSASCLLVRRRAFHDVGGFDPIYAPAYFEDVDLCLALAERGGKIVYEPRAVVTHVRGGSSPESESLAIWGRNRPLFEAKWRHRLASCPPYPERRPEKDLRISEGSAGFVRHGLNGSSEVLK